MADDDRFPFHRSKADYDKDKGKFDPNKPSKLSTSFVSSLIFDFDLGGKALGDKHPAKDHNEDARDKVKKGYWENN